MKPQNYPNSPAPLWNFFYEITQIPHASKKEDQIRQYLIDLAKKHEVKHKVDRAGNVIIYIPASQGKERCRPVIIQNHIDMVCDKTPASKHNFDSDPLKLQIKNGRIYATETTLGADNGLGCAVALAFLEDKEVSHPPLELLFTVDEETGLHGAKEIDPNFLSGKRMINLDTEEWGAIYIGCAGGIDYDMNATFPMTISESKKSSYEIRIEGLCGGHSGMDIHRGRGNALKLMGSLLTSLRPMRYELVSLDGGKAHNIIPRDTFAVINMEPKELFKAEKIIKEFRRNIKEYLPEEDASVTITIKKAERSITKSLPNKHTQRFLNLITMFPHGAKAYDWSIAEPLAQLSSNLAIVRIKDGTFYLQTSVRFMDKSMIDILDKEIRSISTLFRLELRKGTGYPSWKPDRTGSLLAIAKVEFERLYGKVPIVKAIHAGLECGILKEKLGANDILSIGPNISGAHSPTESLDIETTKLLWDYLAAILEKIKD